MFLFQAYDIVTKKCQKVSSSYFNYTRIDPNDVKGFQIDITNITVNMPQCKENYERIHLLSQRNVDPYDYDNDFLTWFKG